MNQSASGGKFSQKEGSSLGGLNRSTIEPTLNSLPPLFNETKSVLKTKSNNLSNNLTNSIRNGLMTTKNQKCDSLQIEKIKDKQISYKNLPVKDQSFEA